MNTNERHRCNVCKVNLTLDKFKKKRDDTYQKGCNECLVKRRIMAQKRKQRNQETPKEETPKEETPEERAIRIFAEDKIIRKEREEREEQQALEENYQKRIKALDKYNIKQFFKRVYRPNDLNYLIIMLEKNPKFKTQYEEQEYLNDIRRISNRLNDKDQEKMELIVREYLSGIFNY